MTVYALWITFMLTTPNADQILDTKYALAGVYTTAEDCQKFAKAFRKIKQPPSILGKVDVSSWAECRVDDLPPSKKGS